MLTIIRASRSLSTSSRLLHTTSQPANQASARDPRLSQGNVSQPHHNHPGDPHDQAAREGQRIGHAQQRDSGPYDAASRVGDKKAERSGLSGNQEGVGFAEQVGSASSLADTGAARPSAGEGKGGKEESTPPGLMASIKSMLGLATSSGEVKQNRGGGVGVTGTGALPFEKKPEEGRRPYHTSAVREADKTKGQAPPESRRPKERTNVEQNEHLQHKTAGPDSGKGNAAADPKLPSHETHRRKTGAEQKRSFSTSGTCSKKHTADSYLKDVDQTSPPEKTKTYQVDGSATGPEVQRPDEPLSGQWSRAGAQTKEYATVSKKDKYDVPPSSGPERDEKSRYGNMPGYDASQRSSNSQDKANEGPEGASRGGRKPERP